MNSHVVNIPRELSSTHFHPLRPQIGGLPQTEMYLVLDPQSRETSRRHGREASIILFPDLTDLRRYRTARTWYPAIWSTFRRAWATEDSMYSSMC